MQQQPQQLATVNVGPPPAYAPASQAPVPWVATAPRPTTTASHYKHRQAIFLGVTLIVVGLLSIAFNIVDICISKHTATEHDDIVDNYNNYYYYNNRDEYYNYMSLGFVGHGFWSGMMSAVAGAFAVAAGRRQTLSQIRVSLVLCVVAASFLLAQFSVSLAGAISVGFTYSDGEDFCCTGSCSYYNYYDTDALPAFCRETAALIAMESLLALASVIGGIAAVWVSVCGCRAACCCSNSANPVQTLLVYPQMIQNGVPVAFTSIQQQTGAPNMIPVSYHIQHPADCSVDVRAYSAGVNSPVNGYVTLNSHQIWAGSWCCQQFYPNRRGVNIIVVDPFSCTHSDVRNFDTFRSVDESADLVAYLQYVRDGAIIIGVTGDEATKQLAPAIRTLRVAGIDVGDVQYRGNFVFVIQKGYIEKTLMSKALTNKVPPATISVRLQGLSTEDITIVRA